MPRIQFSDVTPPGRRSIRNIPIPSGGKRKVPSDVKKESEPVVNSEPEPLAAENKNNPAYEYYYPKEKKLDRFGGFDKPRRKRWIFGTLTALAIAIFIVVMMTVFASATITITPKTQDVNVDLKVAAVASELATTTMRYEVVKLSDTKTISVPATSEEAAEIKASGKIVVYNNFSADPQRLITRTRFESPEGLIFRIADSIMVPGKTTKNGVETPGSIEVTVFADEPGDKYNIKKTDFTIPGFKSDPNRYKGFYARSSADMTGGFVGKRKTVSDADKQTALQSVDSVLEVNLQKNLESKAPADLLLLSGSIIYKSKELPQSEEGSSVVLGREVTAYALMLNRQDLTKKIIGEYISGSADWNNIKSTVKDFSLLNVSNVPDNLETSGKIELQITGKVRVLADIDAEAVNQKLLGAPKGDAGKLIDEFAGIRSVTAAIRPVWKQSFPKNPLKIYVLVATDN